MVVGNLIFILNLLVVTKKSITNSSKNLVFQVNVFVCFILQSCFKYMIMTTIKKKKKEFMIVTTIVFYSMKIWQL